MSAAFDGHGDPTGPPPPGAAPVPHGDQPAFGGPGSAATRRRSDPTGRGTATLPELRRLVENQFLTGFSHRMWVTGQVDWPQRWPEGSLHFELLAVAEDAEWLRLPCDIAAEALPDLRSLLDRVSDADLDDVVAPGRAARVGGLLRYDFRVHRLALAVSAVDPSTTAQALAEARTRSVDEARAAGLTRHQRRLAPPVAPVHVALIGGGEDPALSRTADRLRSSGYAVHLRVVPVALAGAGASARLCEALAQVAGHCDIVLLVRGEGRDLELAAFDGADLARAVAATPVPVVAGLGGRGERTVCDEVAAESVPTADAAVDLVLDRLAEAEQTLRGWRASVREEAGAALARARHDLETARRAVEVAAAEAQVRAEEAARRRRRLVLAAAGLATAVIAVAVLVTGSAWPLLFLLAVAGAVAAERWAGGSDRRGSSRVIDESSFAQVLQRLERIREELTTTSNPETVHTLHDEARHLVERGETVLGRSLDGPTRAAAGAPVEARDTTGAVGSGAPGDVTSVVVLPDAAGATRPAAEAGAAPTGRDTTAPAPAGGDADTTQVLPTTSRR